MGLARPEELGYLTGPVIADQQATVGSFGDGQRMREPDREIGHLPTLACAGSREHHPYDPAAGRAAWLIEGEDATLVGEAVRSLAGVRDYVIVMASGFKPFRVRKSFAYADATIKSRMGSL